ncbi:MAG: type II secretion system minor pseudopilin GspH [Woeseiaceae bacterium]|nr:type II secretion system minor pseudopilin GspH [Woeseiaceae bacterium]
MRNKQNGFSLLEIMVVIVIVGIILSVSSFSVGILRSDRQVSIEVQRFIALTEVAQDEAEMQGREFGIEVMTTGYRFVEYNAYTERWTGVYGDDTLRLRALPDEINLELYLENKVILLDDDPVIFKDDNKLQTATEVYSPHLLIYSSGDITPFELHFVRDQDNAVIALRGDVLGVLEIINLDKI